MAVTLWVRSGEGESDEAVAFLRRHGYRPDVVRDVGKAPPTPDEWLRLGKALGSLTLAVAPAARLGAPSDEIQLAAWLGADSARVRWPIMFTPKGAVAGFRERAWMSFLDMGPSRGA